MNAAQIPAIMLLGAVWPISESRVLAIFLLVGLVVFAVALLALILTRWGQANPLSKCVALSVFAHLLLMTYACSVTLLQDVPPAPQNAPVTVSLIDPDSLANLSEDELPWNDVAEQSTIAPDVPSLPRTNIIEPTLPDREQPIVEPEATMPIDAETAGEPDSLTPLPLAEAPQLLSPEPPPATSDAAITAEELANQPSTETFVEPLVEAELPPLNIELPPAEPNREEAAMEMAETPDSEPLQSLVDVPLEMSAPDAIAADQDKTQASDNHAPAVSEDLEAIAAAPPRTSVMVPVGISGLSTHRSIAAHAAPATRSGDGSPLPRPYRARVSPNRMELLREAGGDETTEAAVQAALRWLAANQEADGRWDASRFGSGRELRILGHDRGGAGSNADSAVTGLALLAFLGAGHSHLQGDYTTTVQHGLEYLLRAQARTGSLAGQSRMFAQMYSHGIAGLAVCEAYAMTGDHRMLPFVRQAVAYTLRCQDPGSGGWRYQLGDREGDTSQLGWQLMLLRSAELAGIPIPQRTRQGIETFLDSVSVGRNGGLATYRVGGPPTTTMTAEALASRLFLDRAPSPSARDEAAQFLLQQPPRQGPVNLYYWYYGTIALYQLHDENWERWNSDLKQRLLSLQEDRATDAGSWAPETVWGNYGGRVYSTAMATLCLEVYYRYLPIYVR